MAADLNTVFVLDGDLGFDRNLYVRARDHRAPNLRETWVEAKGFGEITTAGGAGLVASVLKTLGYGVRPEGIEKANTSAPGSLYLLTENGGVWRVAQALVAARDLKNVWSLTKEPGPRIIVDYDQGWFQGLTEATHKAEVTAAIKDGPVAIRTHDPSAEQWREIRRTFEKADESTIWFSPFKDLDGGNLRGPWSWEDVRTRILAHLRRDQTIWNGEQWRARVVIQIEDEGALLVAPGSPADGELMTMPGFQPGCYARRGWAWIVGSGAVFVATLAETFAGAGDLRTQVQVALRRTRLLLEKGYLPEPEGSAQKPISILGDQAKFTAAGPEPNSYPHQVSEDGRLTALAAGDGTVFSQHVSLRLGDLVVTEPDQARDFLALADRLKTHVERASGVLSFAIFGDPGSGKSFVAKEVAKAAAGADTFSFLTFNLSQMTEWSQLISALRKVQNESLSGRIPFVLWDEFDGKAAGEQSRGWLSKFLMPMEDAKFETGGDVPAKLGCSVFAFVGGTFRDVEDFNTWAESKGARELKGPDFRSRLDRTLSVPSANPRDKESVARARRTRAMLLRTRDFLQTWVRADGQGLEAVDRDVLAWLLDVPLANGARSLRNIVIGSRLAHAKVFRASNLPSRDVLRLHLRTPADGDDLIAAWRKELANDDVLAKWMRASGEPVALKWAPEVTAAKKKEQEKAKARG